MALLQLAAIVLCATLKELSSISDEESYVGKVVPETFKCSSR
jgi:hypothetical protein